MRVMTMQHALAHRNEMKAGRTKSQSGQAPALFMRAVFAAHPSCATVSRWPPMQMEWVDGEIWGNVWQTECIARIDPATGAVLGWVMLQVLAHSQLSDKCRRSNASPYLALMAGTLQRPWRYNDMPW
jgi:Glutamine cyclotransferase